MDSRWRQNEIQNPRESIQKDAFISILFAQRRRDFPFAGLEALFKCLPWNLGKRDLSWPIDSSTKSEMAKELAAIKLNFFGKAGGFH